MRRVVVPLVVLALAGALWLWSPRERPVVELPDEVLECSANLVAIHAALVAYSREHGAPPSASGLGFFEALFGGGFEDTPENRARLECPGTGRRYASRDQAAHPLARYPAGGAELTPVAACLGRDRMPHEGRMNVLYSDGSVVTLQLEQEIASGNVPPGTQAIGVGPASPLAELRVLTAD